MNKIVLGIVLGGVLGIFDGLTAWLTPEVRPFIMGIVLGSTFKGIVAGFAAGWFARKVRSVPAGVVFGLAVGMLLAYLVAAMPSATGKHYYFAIMLPGSILGAVVGWATQRYGRSGRGTAASAAAVVAALALLAPSASFAVPRPDAGLAVVRPDAGLSAAAAFERLKGLAGSWDAHLGAADGPPATVVYRVTGGGSVVMETMFPNSPQEMVTMYTVSGDDLVATHYCDADNQPVMKLDRSRSTASDLVFGFVSVGGVHAHDAPHIDHGRIRLMADGRVEAEWTAAIENGKNATHPIFLSRAR